MNDSSMRCVALHALFPAMAYSMANRCVSDTVLLSYICNISTENVLIECSARVAWFQQYSLPSGTYNGGIHIIW